MPDGRNVDTILAIERHAVGAALLAWGDVAQLCEGALVLHAAIGLHIVNVYGWAPPPRPTPDGTDDQRGLFGRSRSNAAQLQLKVPFDVDLDESRQQPCADHLLERLAVARIRRVRQKDDAPEVQGRLLRPAYSMSDMKERLERARQESVAGFFNHPRPTQEIDGLLRVADENVLEDASVLRRDPSALH